MDPTGPENSGALPNRFALFPLSGYPSLCGGPDGIRKRTALRAWFWVEAETFPSVAR